MRLLWSNNLCQTQIPKCEQKQSPVSTRTLNRAEQICLGQMKNPLKQTLRWSRPQLFLCGPKSDSEKTTKWCFMFSHVSLCCQHSNLDTKSIITVKRLHMILWFHHVHPCYAKIINQCSKVLFSVSQQLLFNPNNITHQVTNDLELPALGRKAQPSMGRTWENAGSQTTANLQRAPEFCWLQDFRYQTNEQLFQCRLAMELLLLPKTSP